MQLSKNFKTNKKSLKATKKSLKANSRPLRKSPEASATSMPEGSILRGNDGNNWVIKKASNGVPRWVEFSTVEMNGYKALTVDYLAKNINKEIIIYEREYKNTFPTKGEKLYKLRWVANGNAKCGNNKKIIENWLKKKIPEIIDGVVFLLLGLGNFYEGDKMIDMALQVDSKNKKLVSSNIMNMEAFIKL